MNKRFVRKQPMNKRSAPRHPSINRLFLREELEALGLPEAMLESDPVGFNMYGIKRIGVFECEGKYFQVLYQEPYPRFADIAEVFKDWTDCPEVVYDNEMNEWVPVKPQVAKPLKRFRS